MSNIKVILVDGGDGWEKYTPLAINYAKQARARGMRHGYTQSYQIDGIIYRVVLDDYSGDKAFVSRAPCVGASLSGFLDTFKAWMSYPIGEPPLRVKEVQEAEEDLPRMVGGEFVEGDPVMSGLLRADLSGQFPQLLAKEKVPRQPNDDNFRNLFRNYKPSLYTGIIRRAIQSTFGSPQWECMTYRTTPGGPLQFIPNFVWGDSWGVILRPGTDGSIGEHYFLIKITAAEVFWVPASFCVYKVATPTGEEFVPVFRKIEATAAVSIGAISYVGASHFDRVGWSYSYKEPKASVVLYDEREDENRALYTAVATITIGFSSTNIPSSAVISVDSPERLFVSGAPGRGAAHRLGYDMVGDTCVQTIKPTGNAVSRCDAPMHIFYTVDSTTPVVARYRQETPVQNPTVNDIGEPPTPMYAYKMTSAYPFASEWVQVYDSYVGSVYGTRTSTTALGYSVLAGGASASGTPLKTDVDSTESWSLGEDLGEGFGGALYFPYLNTSTGIGLWNLVVPGKVSRQFLNRTTLTTTTIYIMGASVMLLPDDVEAVAISSQTSNSRTGAGNVSSFLVYREIPGTYYATDTLYGSSGSPLDFVVDCLGDVRIKDFVYVTSDAFGNPVYTPYPPYRLYATSGSADCRTGASYLFSSGAAFSPVAGANRTHIVETGSCYATRFTSVVGAYVAGGGPAGVTALGNEPPVTRIVTSTGTVEVRDDSQFTSAALRYWGPPEETQSSWSPVFYKSAFGSGYVMGNMSGKGTIVVVGEQEVERMLYDAPSNSFKKKVVVEGVNEYNTHNSLTGWIGVV